MTALSRRQFLSRSTGAALAAALPVAPAWSRSLAGLAAGQASDVSMRRLTDRWEYFQGPLDNMWEVWNEGEIAVWEAISLPHCFNHYDACDPDTPAYRGEGWYRTRLVLANPYTHGRTLLHFAGAGQTTDVYLGDEHLAQHIGGYDEFVVDITKSAKTLSVSAAAGEPAGHRLAVRCNNSHDVERMPSDLSDFTLYGGLYRHVTLVYLPALSVEAVHAHVELAGPHTPAKVTFTGRLYNPAGHRADDAKLTLDLLDPRGKVIASRRIAWSDAPVSSTAFAGEHDLATFTLPQPELWSPSTPKLYQCRVTLTSAFGTHTLTERFGVRHIDFILDGPFHLNGERLLLHGTHRHEDHAGYAAAVPDDITRQEFHLIKKVGANFIRLAHYQQSQLVLDLCDELGILVWEETPWCRSGVAGPRWRQMGRDKLRTMIDQHFNHPAIIFWGLGNEDDWPTEYPSVDEDAIRAYMSELNALAHQLDSSRYTSYRRCDFARDIPDAYSPSIWAGWYSGRFTEYEQALETQRKRVKRLIHIEWGADSHARRHSEDPDRILSEIAMGHGTDERGLAYKSTGGDARVSRDGDWSETYACNLFDWTLKVQESLPWFSGAAQWIFKDFSTPLRVENPVPRINQKGMIERDMTPKEAYYVFQSYWAQEPMVRLYGHTWPVRWGAADEKKLVKVYSNCLQAELFLNGISLGTRQRNSQDYPCAGLRWQTVFKPGHNHLKVIAKPASGASVTDEIEFIYQTETWSAPAHFRLEELLRDASSITVLATLHDAGGILCLDARNEVRFSLSGDGALFDNRGTSTGSRVVQLYNGRAQITLNRGMGPSCIAIASPGLPTALLTLSAT